MLPKLNKCRISEFIASGLSEENKGNAKAGDDVGEMEHPALRCKFDTAHAFLAIAV